MSAQAAVSKALLNVQDLRVRFATEGGDVQAVDGVSFDLAAGEVLAIVGESGSGKSVTAQTIMGLIPSRNATIAGSVRFRGRELTGANASELQKVRGAEIATARACLPPPGGGAARTRPAETTSSNTPASSFCILALCCRGFLRVKTKSCEPTTNKLNDRPRSIPSDAWFFSGPRRPPLKKSSKS